MTPVADAIARADALMRIEQREQARDLYLEAVSAEPRPGSHLLLKLVRCLVELGDYPGGYRWLIRLCDVSSEFLPWMSASTLLAEMRAVQRPVSKRTARIALCGTYTTSQLSHILPLAALRAGVDLGVYESPYGQYRQEFLDPTSGLHRYAPQYVVLAPHEGAMELPRFSDTPGPTVHAEVERWTSLWAVAHEHLGAGVVQHNFALRPETALGHLATRLPSARETMAERVNAALGEAAGADVSIVDCDRLAAAFGKHRWFDDRYWFRAKQAVALDALPLLARHTVAVLTARLGLARKCLVLDLDNTLWGGVIGEDGLGGIRIGDGAVGEAYTALQEHVLELKRKGVVLAVASKNDDADAREPFERHPDMRLQLDDFAVFIANWDDKPSTIREIAARLNLGLDSLVFVDDSPAEREIVRQSLPDVDVIELPVDPSAYRRALSDYPFFETASLTAEDVERTAQYRANAEISRMQEGSTNIEDFWRSLRMVAYVAPFDDVNLPRIAQLVGKTNQFNLTGRRRDAAELRILVESPKVVHLYLRLRDRFADHGLVSVLIAERNGEALEIDTWLMSCRVIGRTVENELLSQLCERAMELGCSKLRGVYIPSEKNGVVRDLYSKLGFELVGEDSGTTSWEYDIARSGRVSSDFIGSWDGSHDDR